MAISIQPVTYSNRFERLPWYCQHTQPASWVPFHGTSWLSRQPSRHITFMNSTSPGCSTIGQSNMNDGENGLITPKHIVDAAGSPSWFMLLVMPVSIHGSINPSHLAFNRSHRNVMHKRCRLQYTHGTSNEQVYNNYISRNTSDEIQYYVDVFVTDLVR